MLFVRLVSGWSWTKYLNTINYYYYINQTFWSVFVVYTDITCFLIVW